MFEALELENRITHFVADLRDPALTRERILQIQPDFVFHMAAQTIVATAYEDPLETFQTNVMGTVHVLEALRLLRHSCTAIMITSDKCYENIEITEGYKETDHLGGKDPYSASKGACEVAIHSYFCSYFDKPDSPVRLVSVRAGNIVGGGDWAVSRLVPDCMRAWSAGSPVAIRNPLSVRPWQHVLEPLSGYLRVAQMLHGHASLNGEAFNFGPWSDRLFTVAGLIRRIANRWGFPEGDDPVVIQENPAFKEANLLVLDSAKALQKLAWRTLLDLDQTADLTASWYRAFYEKNTNLYELTREQILEYVRLAEANKMEWTV
jgi:CDP-glucose 4,6-dehydratase